MRLIFEVKLGKHTVFKCILNENFDNIVLSMLDIPETATQEEKDIITRYYNTIDNARDMTDMKIDRKLIKYLLNELSNKVPNCSFTVVEKNPYDIRADIDRNDSIPAFITGSFSRSPFGVPFNKNKNDYDDSNNNTKKHSTHKFEDVIGMDKVKDKLYDVIDQFKNFEKYKKWQVKPIKAVLLYGSPGTGKTYISEALANEIDAEFEQLNISDIFQKYIGESEKVIRDLFEDARKREGNTVIFLDEIDSIAKKRHSGESAEARNSILNELLAQMSNSNNDKIFLIFATNVIKLLDPAFLRSGRVDFKIEVPLPDINARKGILELNSKKRPMAEDVDLYAIAKDMSGRNCADVELVANEAARRALKAGKECVEQEDFINAYEEQVVGSPDKDRNFEEFERKLAAVHEVGHLITNHYLCEHRTIKRISILPRGGMLGFVHYENSAVDKYLSTKKELVNNIISVLAGRAAEEVIYGKDNVTTGASNDIEVANDYARSLVTEYGMDEEFGFVTPYKDDLLTEAKATKRVKQILEECYNTAIDFILMHKDEVEHISELLLANEELDEEEIQSVFDILKTKTILPN
jgi:cell division protease FtsH